MNITYPEKRLNQIDWIMDLFEEQGIDLNITNARELQRIKGIERLLCQTKLPENSYNRPKLPEGKEKYGRKTTRSQHRITMAKLYLFFWIEDLDIEIPTYLSATLYESLADFCESRVKT